jgi:tRNA U34 2-thiouridine synthase MnmA/TrmU
MAIKVAHHLGVQDFIIFDFRQEYYDRVLRYLYDGYAA